MSEVKEAIEKLRDKMDNFALAYINTCVRCGLCAKTCHYFLVDGDFRSSPAYKLNLVISLFKKFFNFSGNYNKRSKEIDSKILDELIDSLFGRCTLCGRCSINCTVGINIPYLIRLGRTFLADLSLVPSELQATVNLAVEKGNNMGIEKKEWLETLEWLEEELRGEVNDPCACIPIDEKGARILYTVNPREPKFFPLSLLASAKIFYFAKESWTLSSEFYDVTNYGYFSGDDISAGLLSERLYETMEKLNAKILVLGECGHGFNAHRWEGPEWLKRRNRFEIKSMVEILFEYLREGRIKLNPSLNKKIYTLHDPCNLVRMGGIIEEQRYVLKRAVENFVEMTPNREKNYCCGGGGGQLSMTRYAERRINAGKIKAEQIRKTGANVVVAPCHNCIDQLNELNKIYKLGVEVKTLSEVISDALDFS
jgi:Fe-S oxidoreductase